MELKKNRKLIFLCHHCENNMKEATERNIQDLLTSFKKEILKEVQTTVSKEYKRIEEQQNQKLTELMEEIIKMKLIINNQNVLPIKKQMTNIPKGNGSTNVAVNSEQYTTYASVSNTQNYQDMKKHNLNVPLAKLNHLPNNNLNKRNPSTASPNIFFNNSKDSQQSSIVNDQAEMMNNIININKDEGEFQQIKRRQRKRNLGSGDGDNTFQGRNNSTKKIWMFITRVPDNVKASDVQSFIHSKANITHVAKVQMNDIEVTKLSTITTKADNQSFMIGVNPILQEEVYKSSFWPRNIAFERFDFRRGQRFLNSQKSEINSQQHAASFLPM